MENLELAEAKLTVALEAIRYLRMSAGSQVAINSNGYDAENGRTATRAIVSGLKMAEDNLSEAMVLLGNT
jgi:hypothetical protein